MTELSQSDHRLAMAPMGRDTKHKQTKMSNYAKANNLH